MDNAMYKYVLALGLTLLLAACSNSQQPAGKVVPATPGTTAAAGAPFVEDHPEEVTPPRSAAELSADMVHKVLANSSRSPADRKLDADRHPGKMLAFFGLRPDMNVIEVDPGNGWWASILAPLLKEDGIYTAAVVSPLAGKQAAAAGKALRKRFDGHPERFGRASLASFDPGTPNLGTPGSADMVLSFCDVHSWIAKGTAKAMFTAIYEVLKPGGIFGVVDNRAPADSKSKDLKGTPYVRKLDVLKLAAWAGFKLDASSKVNANPDGNTDASPAPADADRMTLRFVKPAKLAHAASS